MGGTLEVNRKRIAEFIHKRFMERGVAYSGDSFRWCDADWLELRYGVLAPGVGVLGGVRYHS